jgi:hypothetical protein
VGVPPVRAQRLVASSRAVVPRTGFSVEAALDQLDRTGHSVDTKDIERLSPLKPRNVNLHGRYSFMLSEYVARGALRPLRDGREPDEDDLDS